jgi:hypothetical protein
MERSTFITQFFPTMLDLAANEYTRIKFLTLLLSSRIADMTDEQ